MPPRHHPTGDPRHHMPPGRRWQPTGKRYLLWDACPVWAASIAEDGTEASAASSAAATLPAAATPRLEGRGRGQLRPPVRLQYMLPPLAPLPHVTLPVQPVAAIDAAWFVAALLAFPAYPCADAHRGLLSATEDAAAAQVVTASGAVWPAVNLTAAWMMSSKLSGLYWLAGVVWPDGQCWTLTAEERATLRLRRPVRLLHAAGRHSPGGRRRPGSAGSWRRTALTAPGVPSASPGLSAPIRERHRI